MGCYWYNVKQLTGVGFVVNKSYHTDYFEKWMNYIISGKYKLYIFCPDVNYDEPVCPSLVILDATSISIQKLMIPGPHYVEPCDHRTHINIEKSNTIRNIYKPMIDSLSKDLEYPADLIHIISSMGIYEFCSKDSTEERSVEKLKEYLDYHGFFSKDVDKEFWDKIEKYFISK